MRPLEQVAIAACVVALCALAGWWRVDAAASGLRAALDQAAQTRRDLGRVLVLRSAGAVARGRRPDADLVARAQQALTAAALPPTACSGVQPRSDQARSGGVHVQTVQLRLTGLTPADLGTWLDAWRTPDQPWQVTELQLAHVNAPPAAGAALDPNRYDVTVALAAPYLDTQP